MEVNVVILVSDVGGVTDDSVVKVNVVFVVTWTVDEDVCTEVAEVVVTTGVAVEGGTLVKVVGIAVVVLTVETNVVDEVAVVNVTDVAIDGVDVITCVDGVTVPVTGGVAVLTTVEDNVNTVKLVIPD